VPIVQIELLEGRSIDQKRAMVKKVTEALTETLNCSPAAVKIMMREIKKEHLATGGVLKLDE
jgi:4-oxalocrotonate tautomerase